jgi:hypothetical protein
MSSNSDADTTVPKIFISYRHNDSEYPAQSISEKMVARYGEENVFFDRKSIPPGVDFRHRLTEKVSHCDVLLAVIGDHWLNARNDAGERRLDDPDDYVRIEIEAALSRQIPVIPVLVGKARIPVASELPETLTDLSYRHVAEARAGLDFASHLDRLVGDVQRVYDEALIRRQTADDTVPSESVEEATKRVLGNYHQSAQQEWDDRWNGVIT